MSAGGIKPPKVPKSRAPEPAFTELSAEAKSERDVLTMMMNMEAEGMPGMSMYSRDALAEKYGLDGYDDGDDDDTNIGIGNDKSELRRSVRRALE